MNTIERRVGNYVKEKGINMAKLSRDTGIPYVSIYSSLINEEKERPLRVGEYFSICKFLGVNPMDFADESQKETEPSK